MFSCKSKGSLSWKSLVDLLSTLHSESFFRITKNGINFNLVDGAIAQVIEADWKKENFLAYECEQDIKIGMDLQMLEQIMKRAKKDDDITFWLSGAGAHVTMGESKSYSLQLPQPSDIKERPVISSPVTVEFEIPLKQFKDIIDDVRIVDDYLKVIVQKNTAIFSTNNKVNKATSTITIPDTDQNIDSTYSIMFLTAIISAFGNTVEKVYLGFIPGGPLRLRCIVEPLGELKYYLAPKLEAKEDGA